VASRQRDFHLFINIVDYVEQITVSDNQLKLFSTWIDTLMQEFLDYVLENPLVSGFYKLLSVVFRVASHLSYFDTVS